MVRTLRRKNENGSWRARVGKSSSSWKKKEGGRNDERKFKKGRGQKIGILRGRGGEKVRVLRKIRRGISRMGDKTGLKEMRTREK